jgi:hypothetical protein
MDLKITLFTQLDTKQFASNVRFFASEKRAELVSRFWDYVANAMQRMFQHGDVKQVNKAAAAAELCGYGPSFRRVVPAIVPFKYDKEGKLFTGSIQSGKRNVLETLNENGVPNWEADLRTRIDGEGSSSSNAKAFNLDTRAAALVKAALKAGCTAQDIKKMVSEKISASIVTVAAKKAA